MINQWSKHLILALITDGNFSSEKTFWKTLENYIKKFTFLSYVGLYLFDKKLKEIILNAHKPKKDQNNISPIAPTPLLNWGCW